MMEKYILTFSYKTPQKGEHWGASSKAPSDIEQLVLQQGYKALPLMLNPMRGKLSNWISVLWQLITKVRSLPKSVLFIQFPSIHPIILRLALPFIKKHYLIALLHDINSIRVDGKLSSNERILLSQFQELHVHSDNMRTYFEARLRSGIKYHVLDCFPYLAAPNQEPRHLSKEICFAGNLNKSVFLEDFIKSERNIDFILYGTWTNNVADKYNNVSYLGCFTSENVQHLKGSWGLVWDGVSLDACSGNWGEYLKIIAPHKFSMYLVAELPLIVWKESAMAKLVEQNKIGITINTLTELADRISHISSEEYDNMISNIRSYRMNKKFSF